MKTAKSIMLMALGAGSVLMYQKYNKPLMKKMSNMMNQMGNELEDMS